MGSMGEETIPIVRYKGILYSSTLTYDLIKTNTEAKSTNVASIHTLPSQFSAKIIIIDSIKSGTGRDPLHDIYEKIIKPLFKAMEITNYEYHRTESMSSVAQMAVSIGEESCGYSSDIFLIMISGDTSISEFLNGLNFSSNNTTTKRKKTLYISNILAGTGNALSSTLGIYDPIQSVALLFHNKYHPLPMHQVSFHNCTLQLTYQDEPISSSLRNNNNNNNNDEVDSPILSPIFIAVFSWLFHAALVADSDTPELRKLGATRFGIAARQNLEKTQRYPGSINIHLRNPNNSINGTETEQVELGISMPTNHSYLTFTALNKFEQNFKISPLGNLDDLYLIEVPDTVQGQDLMDVMVLAYKDGAHVKDSKVNYTKVPTSGGGARLTIDADELDELEKECKLRFCVDGSIVKLSQIDQGLQGKKRDIEIDITKFEFKNWDIELVVC